MKYPAEVYDAVDAILMVTTLKGEVLAANRACREATGFRNEELCGQSIWDLFFHPSEQELVSQFIEEVQVPPYRTTHEHVWRIKSGQLRRVSFTLSKFSGAEAPERLVVTALDITELRQAEAELWSYRANLEKMVEQQTEELRTSQRRLSGILDTAEDAVISIDSEQNIILYNHGAEQIFGYTASEVIGQPLTVLLPQRYWGNHHQYIDDFGRSDQHSRCMADRSEIYGRRKDGSEFDAEANISQLEVNGEKIYTAILRDITERKQMERQLRESLTEKDVLLREIHHRVKKNLQVISSLFTLQSRDTSDEHLLAVLKDSQHRIQSMALIHEKIYQSEGLVQVPFDQYIRELTVDIMQSYLTGSVRVQTQFDLESVGLDIDTAIPCALILNELVSNALKHAFPENRTAGLIGIALKREWQGDRSMLVLRIWDDGCGLPEGVTWQTTKSLGLRLVRVLNGQLQGELVVTSDAGTCYEFLIPGKTSPVKSA